MPHRLADGFMLKMRTIDFAWDSNALKQISMLNYTEIPKFDESVHFEQA